MEWVFEKLKGDAAIYAFCPICSFRHRVGSMLNNEGIIGQYCYCPMCGEYLFDGREEIDVIWNKRTIEELWEKEWNESDDD